MVIFLRRNVFLVARGGVNRFQPRGNEPFFFSVPFHSRNYCYLDTNFRAQTKRSDINEMLVLCFMFLTRSLSSLFFAPGTFFVGFSRSRSEENNIYASTSADLAWFRIRPCFLHAQQPPVFQNTCIQVSAQKAAAHKTRNRLNLLPAICNLHNIIINKYLGRQFQINRLSELPISGAENEPLVLFVNIVG